MFFPGTIVKTRCGTKTGVVERVCPNLGVLVLWDGHAVSYGCNPGALVAIANSKKNLR
jgi:hypothetical protein